MVPPEEATHPGFLKRLTESEEARWYVARWLTMKGQTVEISTLKKAPKHADHKEYADNGDLYVIGRRRQSLGGRRQRYRIEVKRLTLNFTGLDDWPFKNKYIICAQHSFDEAAPVPDRYITLSKDMRFAGILVVAKTRKKWYVEPVTDSERGTTQECYLCPVDLVQFVSTEEVTA